MNLLSSLLAYTARKLAVLLNSATDHEDRLSDLENGVNGAVARIDNAIGGSSLKTVVTSLTFSNVDTNLYLASGTITLTDASGNPITDFTVIEQECYYIENSAQVGVGAQADISYNYTPDTNAIYYNVYLKSSLAPDSSYRLRTVLAGSFDEEVADLRLGADGVTYANAGNAVRGQITDLKSDIGKLATEVEPTNLYDGSRWAVAGYLSDSGGGNATFVSANGYTTTNPIYLEAGDYVFTAYPYSYGANALFCFPCDEDGGNLKSVNGTNIGTTFDGYAIVAVTLSKSGYVRFNTRGLGASRDFVLAKGNSASDFPSAYTPYFTPFKQINNDVDVEAGSVIIKKQLMRSENLFNGEFYPVNGYLGGTVINPDNGYRITSPVYLEAGKYMYNGASASLGGNAKSIVKCNAEGSVIESAAVTATGGTVVITINELSYEVYIADIHISGFYMFNCGNTTRANYFMLIEGDDPTEFPSAYVQYWTPYNVVESGVLLNDEMLAQKSSELQDKMLTVNGDSICAGAGYSGGYAKIIGELEKMSVQNIGVGGGTITAEQYSSGNVARHWVCRTISNMNADADYALLEGGVNDASLAVPLGSITNGYTATLDDTTFYGAMESCLKQLTTRFKGKKYGFIIVHQMSANYRIINEEATSYYWATVRCCEKWGVPYLDLNKAVPPFGIFPSSGESELKTMKDTYTLNGDGWHPTESGYKDYYVPKIIAWMKTL